ncbi:MAG: hypothetical protein ACIAXF_13875 [Phycisphaerales bacterium JB063]
MAGDWIKMELATPEKPEVMAIAAAMGWDDPDLAVGKLFKLWRWFDQHTESGNAASVTPALLNRVIGVTGFAEACAAVGWLEVNGDGVTLPNFDRHNGNTAKRRCQTAKRASALRGRDKSNAPSVTKCAPREEKRREEKSKDKEKDSAGDARRSGGGKPEPSDLDDIPPPLDTPEFRDKWREYQKYRRECGWRALKPRSVKQKLKELAEHGHAESIRAIDTSIANGWQGIFPGKGGAGPAGHRKAPGAGTAAERAAASRGEIDSDQVEIPTLRYTDTE